MKLALVIRPAILPVTLAEAKLHMRVDHADEDSLIAGYLMAAREYCELTARRTFISTTYSLYLDAWPDSGVIELPRPPLASVTGVYYTPDDGSETEFASSNYLVDDVGEPGQVVVQSTASWPSGTLTEVNGVRVEFVAGYGDDADDVPERYTQAIKLMCSHFYENREAATVAQGYSALETPLAVQSLLGVDRGGFF